MKKIIRKVKNLIVGILYSLPFGMKGANDEMFYSKASSSSDGTGIHKQQETNSVWNDLLNTRVTQEVKNLRYQTYFISEESRHYKYYGGDRAAKIGKVIPKNPNIIKFTQKNQLIVDSVINQLNRIDQYSEDSFTLKIKTNDFPLFKLERYINSFSVNLNKETNEYFVTFKFPKFIEKEEISAKVFFNTLERGNIKEDLSFINFLESIEFITNKVETMNDYTKFELFNGKLLKVYGDKDYFFMDYAFENYESVNLLDKYYEEEMAKKYNSKEKKKNTTLVLNFGNDENDISKSYTKRCAICGKPISEFDANMSYEAVKEELCLDCLSKTARFEN